MNYAHEKRSAIWSFIVRFETLHCKEPTMNVRAIFDSISDAISDAM